MHQQLTMLRQRIYAIALGNEDLNDHQELRKDELLLVENFIAQHRTPPTQLILDFDPTDDPVHGDQVGRFFHGYYDEYCFLPLYVFCGEELLAAYLRPSNIDACKHSWAILSLLVKRFRQVWPKVPIIFRGDSGFCRWRMLRWCERHQVQYIVGIAKNSRLLKLSQPLREQAEHGEQGPNPRFVVTNLCGPAQPLYDDVYCARGEMENRIKEQQLGLFADRTSCHEFAANQFRVLLSAAAYVLVEFIRRQGLKDTELAKAQVSTIRLKLLKIGARIAHSARRIVLHLAGGYPLQEMFAQVAIRLRGLIPSG